MLASAGIVLVTSFLFCELHLIGMVLLNLRRFASLTARLPALRPHLFKAALFSGSGFGCWLVDRLACDLVGQVPQLHAWWHLLVSLALHEALVCSTALALLAMESDPRAALMQPQMFAIVTRYGLGFVEPHKRSY